MFQVEDLDGLTDLQVGELAAAADDVRVAPGEVLFRQGEPAEAW